MKKPVQFILGTFILTVIVVIVYTGYLFYTVPESSTLGIPFAFIFLTGFALFIESIIFAIIFYKYIATTWQILLPVFLLTSIIPIYFSYNWYSNRPVEIPKPGQLPVSIKEYEADCKLVIDDYLQTEVDSNNIDVYKDTIQTAFIDTIIYSFDKTNFFAIIIAAAKDNGKTKYCAKYRVGRLDSDKWQLGEPDGNIWSTCFQSIEIFKAELREYYYKSYSIILLTSQKYGMITIFLILKLA